MKPEHIAVGPVGIDTSTEVIAVRQVVVFQIRGRDDGGLAVPRLVVQISKRDAGRGCQAREISQTSGACITSHGAAHVRAMPCVRV